MNKLTIDDINADWIKYVVNPTTGKTARESELEIHDKLASYLSSHKWQDLKGSEANRELGDKTSD